MVPFLLKSNLKWLFSSIDVSSTKAMRLLSRNKSSKTYALVAVSDHFLYCQNVRVDNKILELVLVLVLRPEC